MKIIRAHLLLKSQTPAPMLSKKSGMTGWKDRTTLLLPVCKKTKHQVFSLFALSLTSLSLTDLTLRTSSLTCSPDNFPPPLQPLMFNHPDSLLCNWITCLGNRVSYPQSWTWTWKQSSCHLYALTSVRSKASHWVHKANFTCHSGRNDTITFLQLFW